MMRLRKGIEILVRSKRIFTIDREEMIEIQNNGVS
jgi:hypothetical protein